MSSNVTCSHRLTWTNASKISAITQSDVDVVRALVLIGALLFVVSNLLTDICYALADPRVKLK